MYKNKHIIQSLSAILLLISFPLILRGQGEVIYREAKNTLTPIEMNIGDILKFKLRNGQVRTIILKETAANVLLTNLKELKKDPTRGQGGTLYNFTCKIIIDSQALKMERYVSSQESFYEPYVINGLRIWFDGVSNIADILMMEHGGKGCECLPNKDARFALIDMTDNISPGQLNSWYINKENYIDIKDVYNGDDTWMGGYLGVEAHGGLDINMPVGSPNFTPIPIDDHYFFNSLANGDNNNRWRGIHQWDNGDVWTIQNHHILNLLVPEHTSIKSGIHYADAAGVALGNNEHSHYVFRIKSSEDENEIALDPWILFWQTFEDNKKRQEEVDACIAPVSPGKTGIPVLFRSDGSTTGLHEELSFYWTFGDGGWSDSDNPEYIYANPGIYPVTLVVDDGAEKKSITQHITIDGDKVVNPSLALMAKDEPSFRIRPIHAMDVYGDPVQFIPHSLHFVARATRPKPNEKVIKLQNNGSGVLPKAIEPDIIYLEGRNWLSIEHGGRGNDQQLILTVNATGLATGVYRARVQVECPGALNGVQSFIVQLTIPTHPPAHRKMRNMEQEIIDNSDIRYNRFYCTPYFWAKPYFNLWKEKGYNNNFYLTNGGRAVEGEFARFTPDLEAGKYEVSFAMETPFESDRRALLYNGQKLVNPDFNPDSRFAVRVRSKNGDEIIWMEPAKSRIIGTFEFDEGMDGFVDILAGGSTGQVLVDAIIFKKIH